jgi:hypothetical protein
MIIINEAFNIMTVLLMIAFFPHLYLFLLFAFMSLLELIEYIGKLIHRFIRITIEYIFPLAIVLLLYLAILRVLKLEILSVFNGFNEFI